MLKFLFVFGLRVVGYVHQLSGHAVMARCRCLVLLVPNCGSLRRAEAEVRRFLLQISVTVIGASTWLKLLFFLAG